MKAMGMIGTINYAKQINTTHGGWTFSISLGGKDGFIPCVYYNTKDTPKNNRLSLMDGDSIVIVEGNIVERTRESKNGGTWKQHQIEIFHPYVRIIKSKVTNAKETKKLKEHEEIIENSKNGSRTYQFKNETEETKKEDDFPWEIDM